MIDKEKQTKKSIFKRFTACFLAIFSALLFIFYLGYFCGSVYAEDDIFSDIPDNYKVSEDACDWFKADFFRERLVNDIDPDNDYVFFNTVNYQEKYNFILSFYFCLQDTIVSSTTDTVTWTASGDYFKVFYHGGQGREGTPEVNYTTHSSYYLKGSRLIYNISTNEFNFYVKSNDGLSEVPYYLYRFNKEDGSFYEIRNFETNIEEIDDSLKLEITFNPALEGVVDRSFISDGQTYYKKSLDMVVKNKSNFNIQYSLGIFPASCSTFDPKQAVFIYFRPDMVYSIDLTNEINFLNEKANLMSKNTDVHWLAPGEANYQTFNYSQLPLEQNTQYRVMAIACKTSYMYGSEVSINGYEDIYEDLYQINWDSYELVYDKVFSIGYLKDVPYDYNDKSNAVVPYKNYDDYQSNQYSYWEYTDENGELQAGHNNLWTDKNSFIHNPSDFGGYGDRVNSDNYTDLFTNQATGFFGFLQSALLLMPPEINALMTFTVIAVCFVIILKFVRG